MARRSRSTRIDAPRGRPPAAAAQVRAIRPAGPPCCSSRPPCGPPSRNTVALPAVHRYRWSGGPRTPPVRMRGQPCPAPPEAVADHVLGPERLAGIDLAPGTPAVDDHGLRGLRVQLAKLDRAQQNLIAQLESYAPTGDHPSGCACSRYPRRDSNPHSSAFKAPASAVGLRGRRARGDLPRSPGTPGRGRRRASAPSLTTQPPPRTAVDDRPPGQRREPWRPADPVPPPLTTPAAASNSWNGIAIDPRDTISRLKNRASVQSATTRILRLKVGTRERW